MISFDSATYDSPLWVAILAVQIESFKTVTWDSSCANVHREIIRDTHQIHVQVPSLPHDV